jgi:hypothetical protein
MPTVISDRREYLGMCVASWIALSNIYSAGALCYIPKRSTAPQLVRSEAQTNKGQYPFAKSHPALQWPKTALPDCTLGFTG